MNLYDVLKVRKKASHEAIKKAYRKRAMEVHPDRGGSQVEFEEVQLAWKVLGDEVRRAKYDATGQIDEGPKPKSVDVVVNVWRSVVEKMVALGSDPTTTNVTAGMIGIIKETIRELNVRKQQLDKPRKFFLAMSGRFETASEDNFLDTMVRTELANIATAEANINAEVAAHEQAIELLNGFSYRHEAGAQNKMVFSVKMLPGSVFFQQT